MRLLQVTVRISPSRKPRSTRPMQALLIALLLAAGPSADVDAVAGLYQINQMEMGGGLELKPDGRFRYALEYGAVSEQSEGKWTVENGTLRLTTDPMPPKAECDRGYASACFDRTPLGSEDGNLVLYRWDAKILFKPVEPKARSLHHRSS